MTDRNNILNPFRSFQIIILLKSEENSWQRNLLFIAAAQFIAMVGMSSCVPFLPLYIRQLGITNMQEAKLWSGIVFSGPYILSIISVPIWGALGDKYGRKLMVIRAIFGLAIAMFLMGFAQNVVQLFILRIFQGAASGFIAASLAFVSANTPQNRSGYAIGLLQSSQSAGNIIGPFFGGILSDLMGIKPVFFIVSAFCLLSGILISVYVKEKNFDQSKNPTSNLMGNIKYSIKDKEIFKILLLIILTQAGILMTNPILPFFIENLNAPKNYLAAVTGIMIGIVGIFNIIFAPIWGKRSDRKDYRKTLFVSSLIAGIATILQLIVPGYLFLIPFRIILGIIIAAMVPTLYAALNKRSPANIVGGLMGIASSATLFGSLISFLYAGFISSWFGIPIVFISSGLLLMIVSFFSRPVKNLA